MAEAPQSSRIIVLKGGDESSLALAPPRSSDTDPGLQPTPAPFDATADAVAGEPDIGTDALLAALRTRDLPEVTATSGEPAAVFARVEATPARRHDTPVPEPAVIAPDPRREPTHRIPRDWVGPLDAMAKSAMAGRPTTSPWRWAMAGLLGAALAVMAIALAQALWPHSVKHIDYTSGPPAVVPTPVASEAQRTAAPIAPRGEESAADPPRPATPRSKPSRSQATSQRDDPEYKLLK